MNFLSALVAVAGVLVLAEDQHHKPCGGCSSREEAEAVVRATQLKFQELTNMCDYKALLTMSTPDAMFKTVSYGCDSEGCCWDSGDMEQWWAYYTCQDKAYYPGETVCLDHKKNGTIVLTVLEIVARGQDGFYIYKENYSWSPVEGKCEFMLTQITGTDVLCAGAPPPSPSNICNQDC